MLDILISFNWIRINFLARISGPSFESKWNKFLSTKDSSLSTFTPLPLYLSLSTLYTFHSPPLYTFHFPLFTSTFFQFFSSLPHKELVLSLPLLKVAPPSHFTCLSLSLSLFLPFHNLSLSLPPPTVCPSIPISLFACSLLLSLYVLHDLSRLTPFQFLASIRLYSSLT